MSADKAQNCCAGDKSSGIYYATPAEASRGAREEVLFVACPNAAQQRAPDAVMAVDVNPASATFCRVLSKLDFPNVGDEVHHSGWNACAGCYGDASAARTRLILPCLHSSRVYAVNTEDPSDLKLANVTEGSESAKFNASFLHTAHCLPDGNVMISSLGDKNGDNRGSFVLLDGKDFHVKGEWPVDVRQNPKFNYDFWYQPRRNVMISTEWGSPNIVKKGFNPLHLTKEYYAIPYSFGSGQSVETSYYGNTVHIWNWTERKIIQSITLDGPTGWLPFEVRFYHEPTKAHAFVGTALGSAIYHFYQENDGEPYKHRMAAVVTPKRVSGWTLPEMPALFADILISMDDRFLYVSCWLHGEIRQYDISNPLDCRLAGRVIIGGLLHNGTNVTVDDDTFEKFDQTEVKGRKIDGGPQMLQLSLDGKRLYVTTSLYSVWDQQFYPKLSENGAVMLQVDVDTVNGGMKLNENFLIDFGKVEGGPYLAHEMRYPGGDCTSDIWV